MIVHRQVGFGMLAIVFLAMSVYCFAGYNMVASFSVSNPENDYRRAALWYSGGIVLGLVGSVVSGIAAWRADPGRQR
jgi:hypothetical protein